MEKEAADYGASGLNSLLNHVRNHFDTSLANMPTTHTLYPFKDQLSTLWKGIRPLMRVTNPKGGTGLTEHLDKYVHKNLVPKPVERVYRNMYNAPKVSPADGVSNVHPTYTASIMSKAASLMPYVNDVYADEPVAYRFALAMDAAIELFHEAAVQEKEPELGEAPKKLEKGITPSLPEAVRHPKMVTDEKAQKAIEESYKKVPKAGPIPTAPTHEKEVERVKNLHKDQGTKPSDKEQEFYTNPPHDNRSLAPKHTEQFFGKTDDQVKKMMNNESEDGGVASAPQEGAKEQRVSPDFAPSEHVFGRVHPKYWHGFVQDLAQEHPEIGKISGDEAQSLELARNMANGHYPGEYFGGNTATAGPKLRMPSSYFARVPANVDRAHKKVQPYADDFATKAKDFAKKLREGGVSSEADMNMDAPVSPATKQKLQQKLDTVLTPERTKDIVPKPILERFNPQLKDQTPVGEVAPKDNAAGEDAGLPTVQKDHQFPQYDKETGEHQDADVWKELPADKRRQMKQSLQALHEYARNSENASDDQVSQAMGAVKRLSDLLSFLPKEERLKYIPKQFQPVFSAYQDIVNTPDEFDAEPEAGEAEPKWHDAPGAKKPKKKQEKVLQTASKVDEILSITAGISSDEFELAAEALLDMGYTDNDIISAAMQKKAEDDSDINGSTGAVLEVAKKFGPVDEDRAHGLPGKQASSATKGTNPLTPVPGVENPEHYDMDDYDMRDANEYYHDRMGRGDEDERRASKARQLLKEALNPGGVNFDVAGNGAQIPNPLNRRRDESQNVAPARKPKRAPSFDELYPSLAPEPQKPGRFDAIRDFLSNIKNDVGGDVSQSPAGEFAKNVKDYLNVGYKGKHDAPSQPNKIQKFVDWLKGVHQKTMQPQAEPAPAGPSLADKTRQLVHQDRREQQSQNMYNDADNALDHIKNLERMHGVNTALASKEIHSLLSVALQEDDDYNNVRIAMNAAGYADEAILRAFN